jgi:hypothetical protein
MDSPAPTAQPAAAPETNLSTVPRAAKLLGIPERTLYNWVRTQRVHSWQVGHSITLVDLDQLACLDALRAKQGLPHRPRAPVTLDPAALMASAVEWDTAASLHWAAARDELAAAYAVCAFFAWLALGLANAPTAAPPHRTPGPPGAGAPP